MYYTGTSKETCEIFTEEHLLWIHQSVTWKGEIKFETILCLPFNVSATTKVLMYDSQKMFTI